MRNDVRCIDDYAAAQIVQAIYDDLCLFNRSGNEAFTGRVIDQVMASVEQSVNDFLPMSRSVQWVNRPDKTGRYETVADSE